MDERGVAGTGNNKPGERLVRLGQQFHLIRFLGHCLVQSSDKIFPQNHAILSSAVGCSAVGKAPRCQYIDICQLRMYQPGYRVADVEIFSV